MSSNRLSISLKSPLISISLSESHEFPLVTSVSSSLYESHDFPLVSISLFEFHLSPVVFLCLMSLHSSLYISQVSIDLY